MAGKQHLEPSVAPLEDAAFPTLPCAGGTYAIGLSLALTTQCTIGALGRCELPVGRYVYVGSAWGPGGLRARVGRHLRGGATLRWHIDTLRAHADPIALWLAPGRHLECTWARTLSEDPHATIVVPRFGASDCRCPSHLFRVDHNALASLDLPGSPRYTAVQAGV